jgi:hypothetical protein
MGTCTSRAGVYAVVIGCMCRHPLLAHIIDRRVFRYEGVEECDDVSGAGEGAEGTAKDEGNDGDGDDEDDEETNDLYP